MGLQWSDRDGIGENIDIVKRLKVDADEDESPCAIAVLLGESVSHKGRKIEEECIANDDIYVALTWCQRIIC